MFKFFQEVLARFRLGLLRGQILAESGEAPGKIRSFQFTERSQGLIDNGECLVTARGVDAVGSGLISKRLNSGYCRIKGGKTGLTFLMDPESPASTERRRAHQRCRQRDG